MNTILDKSHAAMRGVEAVALADEMHAKAMDYYDEAIAAKRRELDGDFHSLAECALSLETQAAELYTCSGVAIEPARTILFKGAAVIAAELKRHQDVIHLAAAGLSGCEAPDLRQDLMRLLKQANFELEIYERDGVKLADSNLRFSIDGDAVGNGYAREDVFRSYFQPVTTLVRRTWQRLSGLEFGAKAPKQAFPIYVSPAHGSMALDIHLGEMVAPPLPGFEAHPLDATVVVQDIVRALDVVQRGDLSALSDMIEDEVYRNNFIELARKLLPNGEDVSVVKLVANTRQPEAVTLTRRIERNATKTKKSTREARVEEVVGQLLLANGLTEGEELVGILADDGKRYEVKVPTHMMDDIVRPLWHKRVVATVQVTPKGRGQSSLLIHCDEATDAPN